VRIAFECDSEVYGKFEISFDIDKQLCDRCTVDKIENILHGKSIAECLSALDRRQIHFEPIWDQRESKLCGIQSESGRSRSSKTQGKSVKPKATKHSSTMQTGGFLGIFD